MMEVVAVNIRDVSWDMESGEINQKTNWTVGKYYNSIDIEYELNI
jgi:hypothetical protein